MKRLEERIAALVREKGPLTGAELREHIAGDSLALWQACHLSRALAVKTTGQRYLRLDSQLEGYARLSPSILREFLTYSIIGPASDPEALERRGQELTARALAISREKQALARRFIEDIREQFTGLGANDGQDMGPDDGQDTRPDAEPDTGQTGEPANGPGDWPQERLCVLLAGDVVYGMAHRVPRPERSTGKLVDGSDIDLVVVAANDVPDSFIARLDAAIYQSKYLALVTPSVREEIDYVVKKMARVDEQLRFDSFKRMVACKILHEGILLHGSRAMFEDIKARLKRQGVARQLEDMEHQARTARAARQEYLLRHSPETIMGGEDRTLFYSAEESEEFE